MIQVQFGDPGYRQQFIVIGSEDKYLYCYNLPMESFMEIQTNGRILGSAVCHQQKFFLRVWMDMFIFWVS